MSTQLLKQICELDVFTLLVFKSIFDNGHANSAAKALNVSAPKISRCLNALRLTFNDELFYRRQQGLKPTPLAESLYVAVCQFTDSVYHLEQSAMQLQNAASHVELPLHIAASNGLLSFLAPQLSSPDVISELGQIRLHKWQDNSAELIHAGELDFGITIEPTESKELSVTRLGCISNVYVVASKHHSLWESQLEISLEHICRYSFLCIELKGFNSRIDPLELFCQRQGLLLPSIERVTDREEWYAHLLTMQSVAFCSSIDMHTVKHMPGLKLAPLPIAELHRLHETIMPPQYFLVEKPRSHRRYSQTQCELVVSSLLTALTPFNTRVSQ
ncbi:MULTISPECIES: LysR family transcriptional regulator [Shewanella]|uniref:LysR family transcriptional regulator n=1 Tax=Shewanella xiamenensis TaxID=332186 RepID=A0AAE4PVU9_9GAMM|nr:MULTISPECIES: LysR family transcriptional regulator [Shewanella]MDN5498805.1 LysR family transcriptional regulator [Shewanella sp.]MDN5526707.1 LysR family transcriptional regulator [Shewanella sp.]MDV5389611.1 LysR family transcriptional regulator [Shewanella xiamenensis]BDA61310.1 LysR family transcriptional regulator [Shewanella xiamenensis]